MIFMLISILVGDDGFCLIYLVFAFFDCSRTTNKCSFVNMAVTLCENVVIFGGMIVASCAIKCAHNVQWIFNQTNEHCCGVCMCACVLVYCHVMSTTFYIYHFL